VASSKNIRLSIPAVKFIWLDPKINFSVVPLFLNTLDAVTVKGEVVVVWASHLVVPLFQVKTCPSVGATGVRLKPVPPVIPIEFPVIAIS